MEHVLIVSGIAFVLAIIMIQIFSFLENQTHYRNGTRIDRIYGVYKNSCEGSLGKDIARDMLDDAIIEELEKCETREALSCNHLNFCRNYGNSDKVICCYNKKHSEFDAKVKSRWDHEVRIQEERDTECFLRAYEANTTDQAYAAWNSAREGSPAEAFALEKWIFFIAKEIFAAQTVEELREIADRAPDDSDIEDALTYAHEEISARDVGVAGNDIEKLFAAVRNAPGNGPAQHLAFAKLRRLHAPTLTVKAA